ncbi:MAG: hypothetical protein R3A52_20740 [Polyangiales bacterium]
MITPIDARGEFRGLCRSAATAGSWEKRSAVSEGASATLRVARSSVSGAWMAASSSRRPSQPSARRAATSAGCTSRSGLAPTGR